MSTLGRKAMKKTLERLRKKANKNLEEYYKATEDLHHTREQNKNDRNELSTVHITSLFAVKSLLEYISTLRDYLSELDEHWDKKEEEEMKKLFKLIRESSEQKQPKPVQKKGGTTGTPIV